MISDWDLSDKPRTSGSFQSYRQTPTLYTFPSNHLTMKKDNLLLCAASFAGKDSETSIILLGISLTLIHRYRTQTSSQQETVLDYDSRRWQASVWVSQTRPWFVCLLEGEKVFVRMLQDNHLISYYLQTAAVLLFPHLLSRFLSFRKTGVILNAGWS